jgi:uncharacterized DUF497 family protein
MKFGPDDETGIWLRDFVPDRENFDWDEGNKSKNQKHRVSVFEVESIFRQERFIFAGRIAEPEHDEWRGLVLGQSEAGRRLALIFTRRGDRLRPISCRPMRKAERSFYEASLEAEGPAGQ